MRVGPNGVEHTYNAWKTVTEADFVTLFIKTWFAFVATLRELYPESRPYYEASGDSPYVSQYKKEFAENYYYLCRYATIEQYVHNVYKSGLAMISASYPRFLVDDFMQTNSAFKEAYDEPFQSAGVFSGEFSFVIRSAAESKVKTTITCTDEKFSSVFGDNPVILAFETDYGIIQDTIIAALEERPHTVEENEFAKVFYEALFEEISVQISEALEQHKSAIPKRGNKNLLTVFSVLQAFCTRAINSIKSSCLDTQVGEQHKLISQAPTSMFLQRQGDLSTAEMQRAYVWFVGFVYRLRNALFHEIIDPLDRGWQQIFKNAYQVLKQIVDANIRRLQNLQFITEESEWAVKDAFTNDPPPHIPINENNASFDFINTKVVKYNQDGAKVQITAKLICNNIRYSIECFVKWDDKLNERKVKNVQIRQIDPLPVAI